MKTERERQQKEIGNFEAVIGLVDAYNCWELVCFYFEKAEKHFDELQEGFRKSRSSGVSTGSQDIIHLLKQAGIESEAYVTVSTSSWIMGKNLIEMAGRHTITDNPFVDFSGDKRSKRINIAEETSYQYTKRSAERPRDEKVRYLSKNDPRYQQQMQQSKQPQQSQQPQRPNQPRQNYQAIDQARRSGNLSSDDALKEIVKAAIPTDDPIWRRG
jgi:hypothetical protein